jgi:hypothetical protein
MKHLPKLIYILSFLIIILTVSPASARIYESNYSAEVTGIPNSDNEPPVTTISIGTPQYQNGDNLYISSSTSITLSATDYGIVPSGVNYTEYKIDSEASWTRYGNPFNLNNYTDGQHTITYRSIDKMSNTETKKVTIIILDKTPPETNISLLVPSPLAGEGEGEGDTLLIEGVTNIVSPDTRFYLNSTDNLSGVKTIQYRIDQGGWLDYLAGFTLSGAGTHTIGYKAKDNVENEEEENTLTVKLISIDITKEISLEPIVLAGAWGSTTSTQTAINNLTSILSNSGLSYYIPSTEDEFKEALRGGRYNTYLLIDFDTVGLIDELKEAINYGDGLIYIKTQPDDEHKISEIFGVQFNGMSTNKDMEVNITESEISSATTLKSKGKAVKTTITSTEAQSWGYVNDKKETYPLIVYNQYGKGKAILFSFDLLSSEDQSKTSSLIINSINYVNPSEHSTRALADEPISINIQNSTEPVDIKVTETLPDNTTADSINPSATESNNTIEWQISLSSNEKKKLQYRLNLPDTSGDYKTNTEITYSNNGNYRQYGNYGLTLTIQHNSSELLNNIITDLNNIQAEGKDQDHISDAIEELNKINQNTSTRKQAENNIGDITDAIGKLKEVSIDVSDIRLKLDELLKIWQKKWGMMPEEEAK